MRLPKSDGGRMVKSLICYAINTAFLSCSNLKNEWHHWKELKQLAKKVVRFAVKMSPLFLFYR